MQNLQSCAAGLALLFCSAAVAAECVKPLAPCPDSPNCIATNDPLPDRRFPPLALKAGPDNWSNVMAAVQAFDRVEIIEEQAGYVHATITSMVFRFVDDLEVTLCEDGKQLAVRSSSRTGRWDLGVLHQLLVDLPIIAENRVARLFGRLLAKQRDLRR